MIVKHHRNQEDSQYQAKRDAPAKLVPDREQGDFPAETLALYKATAQKIGKQRQHGAQQKLKHERPPSLDGVDQRSRPPVKRKLEGLPVCRRLPPRPWFPLTLRCGLPGSGSPEYQ